MITNCVNKILTYNIAKFLVWDQSHINRFSWIFHDVTTFEPYIDEISSENIFSGRYDNHITISSLLHVFESLTPNAKYVIQNSDISISFLY